MNTLFLLPKQKKYTSTGGEGGGKSLIADVKKSDLLGRAGLLKDYYLKR